MLLLSHTSMVEAAARRLRSHSVRQSVSPRLGSLTSRRHKTPVPIWKREAKGRVPPGRRYYTYFTSQLHYLLSIYSAHVTHREEIQLGVLCGGPKLSTRKPGERRRELDKISLSLSGFTRSGQCYCMRDSPPAQLPRERRERLITPS